MRALAVSQVQSDVAKSLNDKEGAAAAELNEENYEEAYEDDF